MSAQTCEKCGRSDLLHYFPAVNEDGWRCVACDDRPGEPPGYAPALDRELLECKVDGLLHTLADAKLVHVSNGSAGESVVASVAVKCREIGRYDQGTILTWLVRAWAGSHAEYWAPVSEGVVNGADPRQRCSGGRLATCSTGSTSGWVWSCMTKGCSCARRGGS